MNTIKSKYILSAVFAVTAFSAFAQDEDLKPEVIDVVRPYKPSVSEAFKVKEDASLPDSVTMEKKSVNYTINSVPVASTFTPAKGKATDVEVARPARLYNNYATLGFGNYTSALAELYSNFQLNRTDNLSIFLKHNSSQGGIDDVLLDDKFYNTKLDAGYTSLQRDMSYGINFGVLHQLYNWYGLPSQIDYTPEQLLAINPQHSYFGISAGGNVKIDYSVFSEGSAELRYFGDSYSSSELYARFQPKFLFDLGGQDVGINVDISYLNGSFDKSYFDPSTGISYGWLNLGAHPYIKLQGDDFSVNLGAAVYFAADSENSESDVFIYPRVQASYRLSEDAAIVYAGVEGGLHQNSYYDFTQENPFVSPTLHIAPTDRAYDGYLGLKGNISGRLSYNLKGSYKRENNRAFFMANPFIPFNTADEGYENENSFGVIYNDMNTLEIFGELQYAASKDFNFGLNASYFNYSIDKNEVMEDWYFQAWNLPDVKASLFINANFTEKFYGGLNLFYMGKRKDVNYFISNMIIDDRQLKFSPLPDVTLDGFVDINLNFGFHVNNRLSVFLKGNNLLGNSYERWRNYPVQGLQFMGGVTYKFDW